MTENWEEGLKKFDGDDDLDEVREYLITEGFVPREPTVYEALFLPRPPNHRIVEVLYRDHIKLHLVIEE